MANTKKSGAKWFYGVDTDAETFLRYLGREYSREKMIVLTPDDMQSIAIEAVDTADRLGAECPDYIHGMSESPLEYMREAFAAGLIPEPHEITKINAETGSEWRNSYEYYATLKKATLSPMNDSEVVHTKTSNDLGPMAAFASGDEIDDVDSYVSSVAEAVASADRGFGEDTDVCEECGDPECDGDCSEADFDVEDEDSDDSEDDED